MNISVIILAAGRSARLGSPKQLLAFRGRTLLEHAVDTARAVGEVVVITGANREAVMAAPEDPAITVLTNNQWEEGMASSIRCGVRHVMDSGCDAALVMVCDQPYVTPGLLKEMVDLFKKKGKKIVAAEYDGKPGTPALFDRSLFEQLLQLKGDKGAKQLIQDNKDIAILLPFPKGITDIDTVADYERLRAEQDDQG